MYENEVTLCAASSYNRKFYLNQDFQNIPQGIKDELKIMCVLFTEDVGGVLTLYFDREGCLSFRTESEEDDFGYDEIGSVLKIKQLQKEKRELFESLEMFYSAWNKLEDF